MGDKRMELVEDFELLRQKALSIVQTGDADEVIWMQAHLMKLAVFALNSTGLMIKMGVLDHGNPGSEDLIKTTYKRMLATAAVFADVSEAILQYFEEDEDDK